MLKALKPNELSIVPPTHVDVFVEHYETLRRWAMHLSEGDPERSEDLLHDFFLHFTISKPDLSQVNNLEAYLYVIIRNLHLSQVRRQTRTPMRSLSVVDFDTVNVSLWASDPRDRIRMRDELGAICQYACIRKESSKAGSVLILRFFHGYYPDEIAKIMRVTRPAVKERLRLARAEAKLYLENPERLAFMDGKKPTKFAVDTVGEDLRKDLRRNIFETRCGEHIPASRLGPIYKTEDGVSLETAELAHIVSCGTCLDEVNSILEIPPLAARYAEDTVGRDPGDKGGDGGTGGGGRNMLDSFMRRSSELYYHEPQELCISVNGQLQGLQRVASDKNEMMLIIDTAETVGFVEVFSEQGIRLLMLNVDAPPGGDAKQSASVNFSDGRMLQADLNFNGAFPALHVMYNDPSLAAEPIEVTDTQSVRNVHREQKASAAETETRSSQSLSGFAKKIKRFHLSTWFQPARLTVGFAMLLILALLWFKLGPTTAVSAAELLNKSTEAETARLANKDRVLHRTFDLEEVNNGQTVSRRRIDVWQNAERGITARRIYDEQGRLTLGDWRSANGIQTIYKRGEPAKLQPVPGHRLRNIAFEDPWQLSLNADEFTEIVGSPGSAQVETRENDYRITYDPDPTEKTEVVKASIILSKEDLRAVEQTFILRSGDETRDYRMLETSYELKPVNVVAPAVFEPNIELIGYRSAPSAVAEGELLPEGTSPANSAEGLHNSNAAPPSAIATAALEVEIVEALNNAGAFMGEQVSVQRPPDGKVTVSALVETAERKRELLAALGPHKNNPAVRINIETVAEAQARVKKQATQGDQAIRPGTIDQIQAAKDESPVSAELKKRFSDPEARAFSDRALGQMRQAWLHAVAMKQISQRFSTADVQSLTPAERSRWIGLIRGHAALFIREAEALRRELSQIFPEAAIGTSGGGAINSDTELQAKVRDLYDASVTLDRDMDRSFGLGQTGTAPVKTSPFWNAFANAVGLARSLASAK